MYLHINLCITNTYAINCHSRIFNVNFSYGKDGFTLNFHSCVTHSLHRLFDVMLLITQPVEYTVYLNQTMIGLIALQ